MAAGGRCRMRYLSDFEGVKSQLHAQSFMAGGNQKRKLTWAIDKTTLSGRLLGLCTEIPDTCHLGN